GGTRPPGGLAATSRAAAAERGGPDARRGAQRAAVLRARGRRSGRSSLRAGAGRRRQPGRHGAHPHRARECRPARQGPPPVAQLRSPAGADRRARARAGYGGGDDRRRPAGPSRAHRRHARSVAPRLGCRLRGARGEGGGAALQALVGVRLLPPLRPVGQHPARRRLRGLPADGSRAAQRAAGDARAQSLPARDDRMGRLHADRRAVPARRPPRGRDQVHAGQDAALLVRRDLELLAAAAAAGDPARIPDRGLRVVRGHPDHHRGALYEPVRAGHLVDHRRPAPARRDPADHGGHHRRVRGTHLRRGQAPAALRRRRAPEPARRASRSRRAGRPADPM
ncbi:MAG: Glycosyltransferase, partial [uncultured Solirubrobacteraceae bacterium]